MINNTNNNFGIHNSNQTINNDNEKKKKKKSRELNRLVTTPKIKAKTNRSNEDLSDNKPVSKNCEINSSFDSEQSYSRLSGSNKKWQDKSKKKRSSHNRNIISKKTDRTLKRTNEKTKNRRSNKDDTTEKQGFHSEKSKNSCLLKQSLYSTSEETPISKSKHISNLQKLMVKNITESGIKAILDVKSQDLVDMICTKKGSVLIQKHLDSFKPLDIELFLGKILPYIPKIIYNQFGNFFFQNFIEYLNINHRACLISSLKKDFVNLCTHPFGNRSIQLLMKTKSRREETQFSSLLEDNYDTLVYNEFGVYVLLQFLDSLNTDFQSPFVEYILRNCYDLISNQVSRCLVNKFIYMFSTQSSGSGSINDSQRNNTGQMEEVVEKEPSHYTKDSSTSKGLKAYKSEFNSSLSIKESYKKEFLSKVKSNLIVIMKNKIAYRVLLNLLVHW
eukprot:CAMPEP_0170539414 /NCGR_PEP_ID=MMETSP0209-20121228/103915_1 /TAXON_ID=665100 ORGANISM="Litonotus pictus, Strain P1" /NCGR_SAMPLE_ID=MMETSP0209 /ASSEMBLY_ACC=CAM_ASM_000301 /LENGTH=444 /DNA_ID=CAMNT_0010841339 /DNA_START=829 /DNA_END=2160 /DNA_ORIENTATION=-